jgi:hypothetical protein
MFGASGCPAWGNAWVFQDHELVIEIVLPMTKFLGLLSLSFPHVFNIGIVERDARSTVQLVYCSSMA